MNYRMMLSETTELANPFGRVCKAYMNMLGLIQCRDGGRVVIYY